MNQSIFNDIMVQFDSELALAGQKQACVLLDNAPCHKIDELQEKLKVVQLILLPKNTTAILQPNDQGIIRSLKTFYKKLILRKVCSAVGASPQVDAAKAFANLKLSDAMEAIHAASQMLLKSPTIRNCWVKSGLVDFSNTDPCVCGENGTALCPDTESDVAEAMASINTSLQELAEIFQSGQPVAAENFVEAEEDFLAHEPLVISDIVKAPHSSRQDADISSFAQRVMEASRECEDGMIDEVRLMECVSEIFSEYNVRYFAYVVL